MKKRSLTWLTMVFAVCGMLFANHSAAQEGEAAAQSPGQTVTWCLYVTDAPNTVRAFGLDIVYPTDILTFNEASKGELLEKGFGFFGVNELKPGRIRVGGMETGENAIAQGSSGRLVTLTFIKKKRSSPVV